MWEPAISGMGNTHNCVPKLQAYPQIFSRTPKASGSTWLQSCEVHTETIGVEDEWQVPNLTESVSVAEDGIRDHSRWLEFRRVLFRSVLPDALGVRLNIGGYACNLDAQLCAFPMPDMAGSHITGSPLYICWLLYTSFDTDLHLFFLLAYTQANELPSLNYLFLVSILPMLFFLQLQNDYV